MACASMAGANGYDVAKAREILNKRLTPKDKSKAQKLSGQLMKDHPDLY